jgi:D-alanine-D-alanine ligase
MAAAGDVPQVAYVDVQEQRFAGRARQDLLEQVMRLGLPVFVKPSHLGSSVGIVRVAAEDELLGALESAFAYDARVIVEAAASGIEIECGVLGRLSSERADGAAAQASLPGEIAFEGDFYDFGAKYEPGGMELLAPARISDAAAARVRELALEAFARAGCDGLARVDFFVDGENVLLNELNTMPGFTPTSVYAKLLDASGVAYPEVVDRLCRLALERFAELSKRAF